MLYLQGFSLAVNAVPNVFLAVHVARTNVFYPMIAVYLLDHFS